MLNIKKYSLPILCWLCCFQLTSTICFAQEKNFHFQHFQVKDGLSSNLVRAVFKDSRNLLWIGTRDTGLNIYDGTSFQTFPLKEKGDTLAYPFNGKINTINEDIIGRIWVGTDIGVFIISLKDNSIFLFPIETENKTLLSIANITKAKNGDMWMLCDNAPYIIIATPQLEIQLLPSHHIKGSSEFVKDGNEIFWAKGQKKGALVKMTKDGTQTIVDMGLPNHFELVLSPQNNLVVSPIYDKELMVLDESQSSLIPYDNATYQITDTIIHQLETTITRLNDNIPLKYFIEDFIFDTDQRLWIATSIGLFVIQAFEKQLAFQSIPELTGKSLRLIHPIGKDNFYVNANGFHKWNRRTHELQVLRHSIDQVCTLVPFQGDSMLLTLTGGDFLIFDTSTQVINFFNPKIESNKPFLKDNYVSFKDSKGIIRAGNYQFIGSDSLSLIRDCEGQALKEFAVYDMIEDQQGVIWMGTSLGLYKIDGCKIDFISLPSEFDFIKINALYERNEQELIIGTKNQGLYHYHKQKGVLRSFNTKNGLSDNRICKILANDTIGIWVSTFHGLNYINLQERTIVSFFEKDGLANDEFNSFSACQLDNGDLLFGGMKGCTVIPHDLKLPPKQQSNLRITGYRKVNSSTQRFEKFFFDINQPFVRLKPEEVYLEFAFANSDLTTNKDIKFAHYLEGVDKDWIYCENDMTARYTNLDAGTYRFFTKMKTPGATWQNSTNSVTIEVEEYFYQSDAFKVLIGFLISGLIFGAIQFRRYQKRQVEGLKDKIASDLHDDIGSTLNGIQEISTFLKEESGASSAIKQELAKINRMSKEAVEKMSDVVWSVNPNLNTLGDWIQRIRDYADDVFLPLKIPFEVKITGISTQSNIDFNTKYHLLMISKEAMSNIIKHAENTQVQIHLSYIDKLFTINIVNHFSHLKQDTLSNKNGLENMKKRAKILNAQIHIQQLPAQFILQLTMNKRF